MQWKKLSGGTLAAMLLFTFTLWMGFSAAETNVSHAALLSEQSIGDAVEDELNRDPAVSTRWLDVAVDNGVVRLSGSADNILAKERAARIAETVKGVRAVVNTIEVVPPVSRTDFEIRDDVKQALMMDPATESYELDVSVKQNVVTLTGTVDSWRERQLSAKIAKGVKGVIGLRNDIVVKHRKSRSDHDIREDIEQTLRWDALVDDFLIEVEVKNGNVLLSGTVGSAAEKRRAIADGHVANVKSVTAKQLEVRLWARDPKLKGDKYENLSDAQIRRAVADALFYDPRVASANVKPEVANGIVTLRGRVDNLRAKRAAAHSASNTVGVIEVQNRLKVRPTNIYSDEILKSRIERSFVRDPFIENRKITVNVQNGAVDLYGAVDTTFEKIRAEDLSSRITGVVEVENHLVISGWLQPYPHDPYVEEGIGRGLTYRYQRRPPLMLKTDRELQRDIEKELFWSPFVDSDEITVRVENGEAILTGTVDTWGEYKAAADNAYEGGAVIVNNKIEVADNTR
jgi:osmotically-inducible protein OsmY